MDEITRDYLDFIGREWSSIFSTTLAEIGRVAEDLASPIRTADGRQYESPRGINAASARLLEGAETICRRHDRMRLLLLFRRTPVCCAEKLLSKADSTTVSTVFTEAMLFGTNCILTFSRERPPPNAGEMEDALRLALIAFAHRLNLFRANYLARRALTAGVSHDELIASYNERQERARGTRPADAPLAMIGPTLSMHYCEHGQADRLPTWLPARMPIEFVQDAYGYLVHKERFATISGLPFVRWLPVWTALNTVLWDSLDDAQRLSEYGSSTITRWPVESLLESAGGVAQTPIEDCRAVFDVPR